MAVEQELLRGIVLMKEGKEEGFNIFYSYTHNYVYSRARMVMENEEDALDLTQETFLQAYKGIASLNDPNAVYAWLRTITFNHGKKMHNKRKHETLVTEESEGIFEDIISPDMDSRPENVADIKETANIVKGMLEELSDDQRLSLVAYYYDGLKISEIAELCGCSENTIKSRLRYAKEALKEKVTLHEKQNRYKLCSVTPAVLFMASEALLTSKKYSLSAASAKAAYITLCKALGFTPTALTAVASTTTGATLATEATVTASGTTVASGVTTTTSAATATVSGASAASGATTTSQVATATGTLASEAAKGGMSMTAKIVLATLATTGTIAATTLLPNIGKEPYADEMTELIQKVETRLEQYNLLETNVFDIETSVRGAFTETEDEVAIATAEGIIAEILTPEMSQFEQVKAIHDYMVINFDYDDTNVQAGTIPATSYTAEGVLSTSYGVSAGYAKTFELLCDCAGIETEYIVGTTYDGLHVWNQVNVDGQWYNIDVTSDDPFTESKTFDHHLENRYSHFMLADEDISHGQYSYYWHYPLNSQYECTATSIGYTAYDYGCPWLEDNTTINYVTSEKEIEAVMLEALEIGATEFTLFVRNDQFTKQSLRELAKINSALGGYPWNNKISCKEGVTYTNNFFTNWTFTIDPTLKQWPILSNEEEVKAFMTSLDPTTPEYQQLGQANVYFTADTFDFDEITEWAFLNGHDGTVNCTGMQYAPERYVGTITVSAYDYKSYTSTEEIIAAFEEAYAQGKEYCDVLYDFRGTNMTHNDASSAITHAMTVSQINGHTNSHAILSQQYDGLLLYRLYFRQ